MKKPEWFKLTENDQPEPYVGGVVPEYVLIALALGIAALFFLFPSKTGEQVPAPSPTIDAIVTPLDPITMPTGDNEEGENDEDNEDSED